MRLGSSPIFAGLSALCLITVAGGARADDAAALKAKRDAAYKIAFAASQKALVKGPTDLKLLNQGTLHLPAHMGFIPSPQAQDYMVSLGNSRDNNLIGLVVPMGQTHQQWLSTLDYHNSGYIRDGEAQHWKPDKMLANIQEGTAELNKERTAKGFPEMNILGWIQPPIYDKINHRLVWSIKLKDAGTPADDTYINYNTFVLGRHGYFDLGIITDPTHLAEDKAVAATLLSNTTFAPGKTYGDFNANSDKVAAYGIAALVGGIALHKLGLLALGFGLLAKFAKLAVLAVLGLGAAIKRFFTPKSRGG